MKYIVAAILLLPCFVSSAATIDVGMAENGEVRTGQNEIWHDPQNKASLDDAKQAYANGEFKQLFTAGSTGLQPGAFWSHFVLRNTTGSPLTLHIEYIDHQLIELNAYEKQPARSGAMYAQIAHLYLADPFDLRPIAHNRFVFPVTLQPHQSAEYLVKFSSDQQGYVFPSMRIWDPNKLRRTQNIETSSMTFLFGGFFLMSVFALVAGIATNEKIFYAYSAYSLSKIIVWSTVLGFTHQYLITDHFHWSYMSISAAMSILCGLVFARLFLQTKQFTPRLDYLLLFMMANATFLLVCALLRLTALSVMSITLALLLYPVLIVIGLVRWRQGSVEAGVFSLAWSVLVFGLVVQALRDLGLVEHNFANYYWPPVASFTEMLAIMAAIGIKVQRLRLQKEHAEHRYTQQLESSKAKLEELVQERTFELEQAKTLAELEARTDPLTGVHNRRSFFSEAEIRLRLAQRKTQPLSLLMFDIDHFKTINDKHGHAIGDDALRAFSEIIVAKIRDCDVFGRLGGEEFALLLNEDRDGALHTAQRLKNDIAELRVDTLDGDLQFTVSIGVAYLDAERCVEELLIKADNALYAAKNQGRDLIIEHSCLMEQENLRG